MGHQRIIEMKHHLVAFALVTLASEVFAVQGTLVTESEELKGDIRWDAEKKHYVVAIRKGKSIVNMQRQREDVVRLDIPEPDEMEKALTLIEKGSAASAVPLLNKIANVYHRLKWDKIALRHLVMAHLAADDPERAFETCKAVMAGDSTAAYSGELAPAFWQVLLKLGKKPLLEQLLAKAVKHGDRPSSAAAQVLRGDLIMEAAKDDTSEIRRALTDGYLRVVLLYQDAPCRDIRREALLKAADCHEKLGRSDLAENFRKQAKAMGHKRETQNL